MAPTCRFPGAWTYLQALPISQMAEEVVQARPLLLTARCRAQLAISFLDDAARELAAQGEAEIQCLAITAWFRLDAKSLADEALELTLRDSDLWLDEEKTHG